jgi:DNA-binding MarR family transcriptional regulator
MHETATDLEQAQALRTAIASLVRRFSLSERADVACCGMTVAQAATLETLRREGAMRLGDLGRRLGIQPSTLSRNVARLEGRGLVERVSEEGDGRAVRARLTAPGRRAAARVEQREIEFANSVLDRLPGPRRRRVLEALPDLLDAVRRSTESCCPGAYDHLLETPEED